MDLEYEDFVSLPRRAFKFPLELPPPEGFKPEVVSTWPKVIGRLELVGGRLLFMPPCGDDQQDVAVSAASALEQWAAAAGDFVVGGNEAGMLLGGEVRAADAAVWRREQLGPRTGGYRRVAPVLAVEVAGQDEGEVDLRNKAAWYLLHGVRWVWILFPKAREALVIGAAGERRFRSGDELPPTADLPGLTVAVDRVFRQLPKP